MKNLGFTLIEALIFFAIFSLIALVFLSAVMNVGISVEERKINAIAYVNTLRPDLEDLRASCGDRDSDGNGYVRCSVSGLNRKEQREIVNCECSATSCVAVERIDR